MQRDGHRFEQSSFVKDQVIWQAMYDVSRDRYKLGESPGTAVVSARDAQNLAAIAEVDLSPTAVCACPTIDSRVEGDAITFRQPVHALSDLDYIARSLMSHDDGRNTSSGGSVVTMHIAAADSASCHTN
jgi:hypothetical protein